MAESTCMLAFNLACSEDSPLRVLHVDDEPALLKVARECLQLHGGFIVDTASSAAEAAAKLRNHAYDAVVCDYQMPEKTGLQFLAELRKKGDRTPFILFTGKGREEVVIEALNAGADGYVEKVGEPDAVYCQLANAIRQAVRRRQYEVKLKVSMETYRTLFDNMYSCGLLLDLKGNIINVNNAVEKYGFTKNMVIGRSIAEFVSAEDGHRLLSEVAHKVRGESVEGQVAINTPRGKVLVEYRSKPIIVDGRVVGILAVLSDAPKLKNVEERYRKQFEETFDAIFLADAETGIILDCNRAAVKLVGREKHEIVGQHQRILHPPSEENGEFTRSFKLHRAGECMTLEDKVVTKTGEVRDVVIRATVFEAEGRRILQGTFHDVTEQRRIEKALREAEARYRMAIMNANVGIVAYDADGNVEIINPKMEKMTGYSSAEIPTLDSWFEKLYPDAEERRRVKHEWCRRLREKGEVQDGRATVTTKDGRRRSFLFNGVQLENGACLAYALDVTERVEAERKLDKLFNELALINEKLEIVGKWTRHDARNKLAVVKGNLYLAKKHLAEDHPSRKYLAEAEVACSQIVKIFDFASAYEKIGVEERVYVDAAKAFDEALELVSGLTGVSVENKLHGLWLLADSQLRQLFYNLVDNSLKHGEKTSRIRVRYETENGQLKLVYEDNGVGVPDENRPNLFREGYGKNTGYGLYLTAKLCHIYGWTIEETGRRNAGAQFTITIPETNQKGERLYKTEEPKPESTAP
jgi:PAS domain S-box-containing protein